VAVFEPQRSGTFPALLVVHGSSGPVSSFVGDYAQQLANFGYVAFFVHYFDATGTAYASYSQICTHFESWMSTLADAVSFAERHRKVDPGRIGLLGVSLGGYLSLSLASQDSRVLAVASLMGGMPPEIRSQVRRMPPTLLLHGKADPVVPVTEAYAVDNLLKRLGAEHELKVYAGQGHSFRGMAQMDALARMLRFFQRHLRQEHAVFGPKDLLLSFR
ncbi:MAG TPA: alpha/beta fold hydrolase, partial [Terriglobales bacterium]|nr:alpha/beta fold hydrolase [Terriglobales bacterium]